MIEYLVVFAIVSVCLLLIVIIMLQKGRGGGLSAALGGGASGSAFGSKTGDVFTWITVTLAGLYLILNIVGSLVFRQTVDASTTLEASVPADGEAAPAGTTRQNIQFGDVLELGDSDESASPIKLNISPVVPSVDEDPAGGDADTEPSPGEQDDGSAESDEPKPVQDPPPDSGSGKVEEDQPTSDPPPGTQDVPAPTGEPDDAAQDPDGN